MDDFDDVLPVVSLRPRFFLVEEELEVEVVVDSSTVFASWAANVDAHSAEELEVAVVADAFDAVVAFVDSISLPSFII